jgi:DNA-binding MarR family transcriptional regulator
MRRRISQQAAAIDQVVGALMAAVDPAGCTEVARVSPTQLRVLTLLRDNPSINVNGLADSLDVGPSSASRLCDRLEALGFLTRSPDPRDRREVQLLLAPAARELLQTLTGYRRRSLARVLDRMPEAARGELVQSLTAFARAAATDATPSAGRRRTA